VKNTNALAKSHNAKHKHNAKALKLKQTLVTQKQGPFISTNIMEVGKRGTKKLRKGINSFRREAHGSSFNPDP